MIVNSTDLKNNLGKFLRDCLKEDVIITNNGRKIAVLRAHTEDSDYFNAVIDDGAVSEQEAEAFNLEEKRMTYEQFLQFSADTQRRYEYIDGVVYLLTSPGTAHQKALGELYVIFYNLLKGKKCTPLLAPYDITLRKSLNNINVVQPDLVVICDLEEKLNNDDRYMGIPVLAIEIISKSTRSRDTIKKMELYMLTGVSEYWLINPADRDVIVYFFKDKEIAKSETFKKDETLKSFYFPDLQIKLKDIFGA